MLRAHRRYPTEAARRVRRIDGMTRDEACVRFQGKVLLLARRLMERLPSDTSIQLDDLVGYGAIGLLEAFDRYDGSRNIQFSTYAEYRIRGAMLDALRSNDSFSRRRRQLAKKVEHATASVRQREGREPEPEEVAAELEITLEEYWAAMDRVTPVSHVSIDGPSHDDDEGRTLGEQLFDPTADPPDKGLDVEWLREELRHAIARLPERERQCVLMYYGKELSLAEIAQVYSVTPSRISQILSKARRTLRKTMAERVDRHDLGLLQ